MNILVRGAGHVPPTGSSGLESLFTEAMYEVVIQREEMA